MTIVSDAVTWRVRDDWRERMGQSSLAALESALHGHPPDVLTAVDVPGWFGDS